MVIHRHLRWWLVEQPAVASFKWEEGETFGASIPFLASTVVSYLALTLLLLILLAGGRRLTFLHVYHHAAVVVMCHLWLRASQSLMPVALVTNAAVHVVMYGYYLSSSVGWRWAPRWKRAVTEIQIWQFAFSFAASIVFLWFHFAGGGCQGMKAWMFNAAFNASLLVLFLNFHTAAYSGVRRREIDDKDL